MSFKLIISVVIIVSIWYLYLHKEKIAFFLRKNRINGHINELKRKIDSTNTRYNNKIEIRISELSAIKSLSYIETLPVDLLSKATRKEIQSLQEILGISECTNSRLITEIRCQGSHSIMSFLRGGSDNNKYVAYSEVIHDILSDAGEHIANESIYRMEIKLIEITTNKIFNEMSVTEQQNFNDAVKKEAEKQGQSYHGLAATGGAIALANASGFGVYIAASTALGTMTSAIGLTLPFAAYTTMSSLIATATGPIGWTVLGVLGVSKLGSVNKKKTLPSVFLIATIRARLIAEQEKALILKKKSIKQAQISRDTELKRLTQELKRAKTDFAKIIAQG